MQPPFSCVASECLPVCPNHHLSGKEWISGPGEELEIDLDEVMGADLLPVCDLKGLFW